jgi:hypothetical protein
MTTAPADGMPSTRGTNCYLADPNLAFVCASVRPADDLARARPHLIAMGRFAPDELKARSLPLLTSTDFEALGQGSQWMTEKTGGSGVGASTTTARRDADGTWRLHGDKWFGSAANAGAALTLARPEGAPPGSRGLAMFLVPRVLPDGTRNAWTLNRLKDKCGSRSMAMRRSALESIVHARGRAAFGRPRFELPQLRREAGGSVVLNAAAAMLDRAGAGSAGLRRRVAAWPGLDAADRELDARPVADMLDHALAGALLLAKGQVLWQERGRARKLLAGALYVKTWLRPPAPPASVFTAAECAWLPALVDWPTVPAEALAEPAGGR